MNDQLTHLPTYSFYVAQTHWQSAHAMNTREGKVFILDGSFHFKYKLILGWAQASFIHTEQSLTQITEFKSQAQYD